MYQTTSKFKSTCASCGGVIPKGINIMYDKPAKKAYHLECAPTHGDNWASNNL